MRLVLVIAASIALLGCRNEATKQRLTPPQAFLKFADRAKMQMLYWGLPVGYPCTKMQVENGLHVADSKPLDQCVKMTPQRRWRGLWRNDFEGSRFCPTPARECSHATPGRSIWLTFAQHLPKNQRESFGDLYAIDFVGRRTLYAGSYGHFGMFDQEVIVDRVISARHLGAASP